MLTATPTKLDPTWEATLRRTELAVWSEANLRFWPFSKVESFFQFKEKSDLVFLSAALVTRLNVTKKAIILGAFLLQNVSLL